MKIKEIQISRTFGGVISEAPYENARPSFTDTIFCDLEPGDNEEEIRRTLGKKLQEDLIREFALLKNNLKAELVEKQMDSVRFSEKDGKKYPHVTSILGWSKDFHMADIDLKQYAARGTLIHKMIEHFIQTQVWLDLKSLVEQYPNLRDDAAIMFRGGLQLKIEDCSHEAFFEQFGSDFSFDQMEVTVWNDKYLYCGRMDAVGKYKGLKSIIDFKTGSTWELPQLAAYAKADGIEGIEQLVVCPLGPTENKSGVKKPVVTKNISGEFDEFLKKRSEFTKTFGI